MNHTLRICLQALLVLWVVTTCLSITQPRTFDPLTQEVVVQPNQP